MPKFDYYVSNYRHTSFWLPPETYNFIKTLSQYTCISQGKILHLLTEYYRLKRRIELKKPLTEDHKKRLEDLERFLQILPF